MRVAENICKKPYNAPIKPRCSLKIEKAPAEALGNMKAMPTVARKLKTTTCITGMKPYP